MRIILNADDFGYSDDTVDATIECFERGALTSATIMPRMPATARAIEFACKHPQFSFGVHLTYVSDGIERPLLSRSEIPDLVDDDGLFLPSNAVRRRALLRRLPVDQIERETEAQLAFFTKQKVRLTHADSHGHMHKFALFRKPLQRILPRFGITRVRNVQNVYLRFSLCKPTYWIGSHWCRQLKLRFRTTDYFYMPHPKAVNWFTRLLAKVREGVLEVGVHPGRLESWRDQERFGILQFAELARRGHHELIGWDCV